MSRPAWIGWLVCLMAVGGCVAPRARLAFPTAPVSADAAGRWYDTDGDGRVDFSLTPDDSGRLDVLGYDDNQDGIADRVYRISDHPPGTVPHLIVLFDSIPYELAAERARDGGWTWFDPPRKVIPPFPTMSPVIFTRLIGAEPLPGPINEYYDRARGRKASRLRERLFGDMNPWERRLHYRLKYWENGLAFLYPRRWLRVDLARAKRAFDRSSDHVTLVYLASTSGMLSQHGSDGARECLDGLEQLCLQVLYERQGAVKISALADHGHMLSAGERIDVERMLKDAGFRPTNRLRCEDDVVVDQDGLVNYGGVHTRRAAEVCGALVAHPEIELAIYLDGEQVIVRGGRGSAAIEHRDGGYRYTVIDYDVLSLGPVAEALAARGKADSEGFIASRDWFDATIDHEWPDALFRLWEAFHGLVIHTPDVMFTTAPGYYIGRPFFDRFIDMASTHGGLNQQDSATFVLTMTGRAPGPMRSGEVLRTIEPAYDPSVLRR